MHDEEQVKQQLAQLGARYMKRTLADLQRIDELLAQLPGSSAALKELERVAHKIHGSGAMFGFNDVSVQAGELEHFAARLAAADERRGTVSQDSLRQQLIGSAMKLREVVNATARGMGIETNGG